MAKHQTPSDGSDEDGKVELDEVDLAALLKESKGQHAADEDTDEDEDEGQE